MNSFEQKINSNKCKKYLKKWRWVYFVFIKNDDEKILLIIKMTMSFFRIENMVGQCAKCTFKCEGAPKV